MNWQLLLGRVLVVIGLTIIAAVVANASTFQLSTTADISHN